MSTLKIVQQEPDRDSAESADAKIEAPAESNSSVAARAAAHRGLQARGASLDGDSEAVHDIASSGVVGAGGALPHLGAIQASFGSHDVSAVRAHTDGNAKDATARLGASAYATGNDVAFKGAPDLHTAAHEAAHVVQQQAGIQLKGGVGEAGDSYEQHADAVADLVVEGKSAEAMLSTMAGDGNAAATVQRKIDHFVQFLGKPLTEDLAEGDTVPEHGETEGKQRRYSVEQYIAMWEKEQGRKLTPREKTTLARGCIGITAMNLSGGGNPPLGNAYADFGAAHAAMGDMNAMLDKARAAPETAGTVGNKQAVLFAKLFWSNQTSDPEARKKPDEDAFRPDPKSGKVDMSGYEYKAQPGYINFDYGFWDEASQSFWHANHSQPGMKVYQSTKEKFAAGYIDFDRIIYCVEIAENYDPGLAAMTAPIGGG